MRLRRPSPEQFAVSGTVLLQSLAFPVPALASVGATTAVAAVLVLTRVRRSTLSRRIPWALLASGFAIALTASFPGKAASVSSALLLSCLLLLTSIRLDFDEESIWRALRQVSVIAVVLSIAQFGAQLLGLRFISVHTILSGMIIPGFNSVSPFRFGGDLVRSNGFFFLEPSSACQFIALGLIAETRMNRQPRVLLILAMVIGMLTTGAGTGFLLLGIHFAMGAIRHVRQTAAHGGRNVATQGLLILALVVLSALALGTSTGRVNELESRGSSFNFRFIRPYTFVTDGVLRGNATLVGFGGGTSDDASRLDFVASETKDATLFTIVPKMLYEYGILLGVGISLLFWANTCKGWPPGSRAAAVAFVFLLNGGPVNPTTIVPAWVISCGIAAYSGRNGGSTPDAASAQSQLSAWSTPLRTSLSNRNPRTT